MLGKLLFTWLGLLGLSLAWATISVADAPEYVGNEGCNCHKTEMKDWAESTHGKALDQLLASKRSRKQNKAMKDLGMDYKKDYDQDEKCLACHTTGFNQPGGYSLKNSKDDLKGAGCEMCHGAGSKYRVLHKDKDETFTKAEAAALGEIYPPNEEMCRKCHDNENSVFNSKSDPKYGFNFKERLEEKKSWHKKYELLFKH
ncbi:MAG: multiheme c-type cytochrome [Nitrospinota bacterium]|nr:multiheme c-type cytochrome [Nitrospinota bacterium]